MKVRDNLRNAVFLVRKIDYWALWLLLGKFRKHLESMFWCLCWFFRGFKLAFSSFSAISEFFQILNFCFFCNFYALPKQHWKFVLFLIFLMLFSKKKHWKSRKCFFLTVFQKHFEKHSEILRNTLKFEKSIKKAWKSIEIVVKSIIKCLFKYIYDKFTNLWKKWK